jgi:hypothetical protein
MISFNFMVCQSYFERRGLPLLLTIGKEIENGGDKIHLLAAEENDDHKMVKLSESDDYESCVNKLMNSFSFLAKNDQDCDWFFFGDDDTFVNLNNAKKFADSRSKEKLMIYGFCGPAEGVMHAHGGAGFLMNKKTLLEIRNYLDGRNFLRHHNSDVTLALNIAERNKQANEKIEFSAEKELFVNADPDINSLDWSKVVSVHVVDRIPFSEIASAK